MLIKIGMVKIPGCSVISLKIITENKITKMLEIHKTSLNFFEFLILIKLQIIPKVNSKILEIGELKPAQ